MKTRTWILIFASLVLVCGAVTAVLFLRRPSGSVANIYRDGTCIYSVDLSKVEEPYEVTFSDERGSNTVRIERGRISVIDADCPDHVCEQTGWVCENGVPIVCLPHRLVIRIEKSGADGFDAVAK